MTLNRVDGLEPSRLDISSTDLPGMAHPCFPPINPAPRDVVERAWASSHGLKASLESSGLFNQDDPDLFSCMPADDIIKTESDQLLTVDLSELFPELMGLDMVTDSKPPPAVGNLDLGSVSGLMSEDEVSPAETDASLDHFFNTFTDLTGFLENFEETGPSNHVDDNSAVLAGNDITNETTTAPSVGNLCTNPIDADTKPNEPLAKQACKSKTAPTRSRQSYRERRDKNNVASRVSRATRKNKCSNLKERAIELEKDNEHLTKQIEELTKIAELSRKHLIEALSNK